MESSRSNPRCCLLAALLGLSLPVLVLVSGCGEKPASSDSGRNDKAEDSQTANGEPADGPREARKPETLVVGESRPKDAAPARSDESTNRADPAENSGGTPPESTGAAADAGKEKTPADPRAAAIAALEKLDGTVDVNVLDEVVKVDLGYTEATDQHLEHLAGFKDLWWLNLSGTKVTDDGLARLKGLSNLTNLYLFDAQVTDAGLRHLGEQSRLIELCLDNTRFTDEGLQHLKELKGLEVLHIRSQVPLTDDGLKALHGLTRLRELKIGSPKITDEAYARLEKALPRCRIHRATFAGSDTP